MEYKLERLYEAARLEKEGDWNQTLDFCQKWVELEPLNCIAWQGVGDAYRKLGQPEKAIEAYRKGIEIAPSPPVELFGRSLSSAPIWYQLGHAFCDLGQLDKATDAFKEATRIEPGESCSWNDLGVVYRARNDYENAFDAFKKAVTLDPSNTNCLKNLEAMYALGGSQEGVEFVRQKLLRLKAQAPINTPSQEVHKSRVKNWPFGHAPTEEAQQEALRIGLAKHKARIEAAARDIDVASTLKAILASIKQGDSLRHAIVPVSWGWSSEQKDVFVADVEQEKARGILEPDAIRAVLTRFSTR